MKKSNEEWKRLLSQCFGKQKNEQYHAIAMLIIFGIIILILVISIRSTPTTTSSSNIRATASPTTSNINDTTNNNFNISSSGNFDVNYSYSYTIVNNGVKEMFTGKKVDEKEVFTYITTSGSQSYAKLSNNYLIKENGEYHLTDAPSINLKYVDIDKIFELTGGATLTIDDNIYTYVVPTSSILNAFEANVSNDIDSNTTDKIIVTLENNLIKKINIDFSNYATIINGGITTSLVINMEFNNIGTTEDFYIEF